jgi:hypothetical protein
VIAASGAKFGQGLNLLAMTTNRKEDDQHDELDRKHARRSASGARGGGYTLARFVIAASIAALWGAANARFYFAHGHATEPEFNLICGSAVAYLLGFEGIAKRLRGKDEDR